MPGSGPDEVVQATFDSRIIHSKRANTLRQNVSVTLSALAGFPIGESGPINARDEHEERYVHALIKELSPRYKARGIGFESRSGAGSVSVKTFRLAKDSAEPFVDSDLGIESSQIDGADLSDTNYSFRMGDGERRSGRGAKRSRVRGETFSHRDDASEDIGMSVQPTHASSYLGPVANRNGDKAKQTSDLGQSISVHSVSKDRIVVVAVDAIQKNLEDILRSSGQNHLSAMPFTIEVEPTQERMLRARIVPKDQGDEGVLLKLLSAQSSKGVALLRIGSGMRHFVKEAFRKEVSRTAPSPSFDLHFDTIASDHYMSLWHTVKQGVLNSTTFTIEVSDTSDRKSLERMGHYIARKIGGGRLVVDWRREERSSYPREIQLRWYSRVGVPEDLGPPKWVLGYS